MRWAVRRLRNPATLWLVSATLMILVASGVAVATYQPGPFLVEGVVKCQPNGTWAVLDDGVHVPHGDLTVGTATSTGIWLEYQTATQIHWFSVTTDERLGPDGIGVGASVGTSHAFVSFGRNGSVLDPIPCTSWTTPIGNVFVRGSFTG